MAQHMADRYARAITSSNLKVGPSEREGDVDALIAAGWVSGDSLGSLLYRLRCEWDRVDKQALRRSGGVGTAATLARTVLKNLRPTQRALRGFTVGMIQREDKVGALPTEDLKRALRLADQLLERYLDVTCPACLGVKYQVVSGTSRLSGHACAVCAGTGERWLPRHPRAELVWEGMQRKAEHFDRLMGRFLSQYHTSKRPPALRTLQVPQQAQQTLRARVDRETGKVYGEWTEDGGRTWLRAG